MLLGKSPHFLGPPWVSGVRIHVLEPYGEAAEAVCYPGVLLGTGHEHTIVGLDLLCIVGKV